MTHHEGDSKSPTSTVDTRHETPVDITSIWGLFVSHDS
jgi:hypothetical protein